jgi:ribosomal protein L9
MSSERRSIEGQLPDGIGDRSQGYEHNPNPEDQVAANRARFEEQQQRLQQEREAAADVLRDVQHTIETQYKESMQDPEHQAFIEEQVAHELNETPHLRGGQEQQGDEHVGTVGSSNAEVGRHVPLPTTPRAAEEFNHE